MDLKLPHPIELQTAITKAGEAILEVYHSGDFSVDLKSDDSPLTKADLIANKILVEYLSKVSDYPVISEEGEHVAFDQRKHFDTFWLVDPLDGTKEFVNRNGEFTVNVALIDQGVPVLGAIYVPVTDVFYWGQLGAGAWKLSSGEKVALKVSEGDRPKVAVGSKSHAQPEEKNFYETLGLTDIRSVGSSLKFCMVAEGLADLYYRVGPTMEWDVAAGHAIVKAAGGEVYNDTDRKTVFSYNKPDLKNGPFFCVGNAIFS